MDLKNRLNMMKDERGSDLFLTAGRPPSMKVDGSIRTVGPESLTLEQTMTAAQERMTSKQFAEFEASSGCQFAVNARGAGRFRISAFKRTPPAGS